MVLVIIGSFYFRYGESVGGWVLIAVMLAFLGGWSVGKEEVRGR